MILTCPECATSFFVEDARIPPGGRAVKCSNCGARWMGRREAEAAPEPAPALAPAPLEEAPVEDLVVEARETPLAEPAPPRRISSPPPRSDGKAVVWVATAVVIGLMIGGLLLFRAQIVRLWPASGAAFASVGLPVNTLGLVIENVTAEPTFQGGRPALAVAGQVRNLRDAAAVVPSLRVSLLDRKGKPVAAKVATPIDGRVPAHAVRHFAIAIVDPPASVHDLEIGFEVGGKRAAVPIRAAEAVVAGPAPVDAKPLAPGSPDALPSHD